MAKGILIVEDERAVRETLREFFEGYGLRVDCAEGIDTACEMLREHRYRVVLADVQLTKIGDTSGLDLADFCRERFPDTAFIVVTGYGSHHLEHEAWRRGVSFFLHKPFQLEDVAQIVFGLLENEVSSASSSP